MQTALIPTNEASRLRSLHRLEVLDTPAEEEFDALVQAAALVCGTPVSLITLIDESRQWFKAKVGVPFDGSGRGPAFCSHTIHQDGILEIPDMLADPRFVDNPFVTGDTHVRFYAGATLTLNDGSNVGTLCVLDTEPRTLTADQRRALSLLSRAAVKALEGRRALLAEREHGRAASQAAAVLRNSVDAIIAIALDGTVTQWNAAAQELFGFDARQMIGSSVHLIVPSHRQHEERDFERRLQLYPRGLVYETLRKHADGNLIAVSISLASICDDDARLIGATMIVRDIRAQAAAAQGLAESEARFRALSDASPLGVFSTDAGGQCTYFNRRWEAIFEMAADDALGDGWFAAVHPDDRKSVAGRWRDCAARQVEFDLEYRLLLRDGAVRYLRSRAQAVTGASGRITGYVGSTEDITSRVSVEQALKLANQRQAENAELLRVTLRSIGDAVITTDAQGRVTWLNPVAERMTGWSADDAEGRPLAQVFHILNDQTRLPAQDPVAACLAQGAVTALEEHTILVSRDGRELGIEDSAAPIRDEQGQLLGAVLVFHDVSEQRRMSGEMSYRATHDALTGLVNRPEFEARLRRTLARAQEDQGEHTLLFIDLDQFKLVNDACGHSAGDQLLQQVARLLGEKVRARDTLARLGGDEFAVILEHCTAQQATRVAQQICDRMDDFRFVHDERRFRIGTSIGLVPVDRRWASPAAVMQAADASCYAAKEAGRNRVHVWYDTDMALQARHGEMQWATRLEQALDEDRFVLFGQKIVPLDAGAEAPLHLEALIRLRDCDGGLIAPGAFLPAAERFNLSSRIDRWVLSRSIELLIGHGDLSSIETLSINLSGQSIGDRAFHRHAIELLSEAGPDVCRRICLEITETAAVTNMADASLFIEQAHALGIRIALDDFGAGASSFGYLKTLAVDVLKIDGQFVKDVIEDPLDDVAVRCFIDVARVIGVKTVAEFVDRPEVLARMKELGVDYAQGFLLHRPEPIEALLGVARAKADAVLETYQ
ncbi:MAG: bifunctional diguanylate cyclase/phosphodiesterase [Rhizobacter sp.]|nr:bifunctional diguanylate cyclase/phosphodiesterase [Rhizobacter sp.]